MALSDKLAVIVRQTNRMKLLTTIFIFFLNHILFGQILVNPKLTKTTSDFTTIQDSIVKLVNKTNSIIIKTCDGYSEFYLTKDSINWEGHFIQSLIRGDVAPPPIDYVVEGITYKSKPILTSIVSFNADTLYEILLKNNINSIKQLTEGEIGDIFSKAQKSKVKNMHYSLPVSSHDCDMTININSAKQASYRNILVNEKRLHCILTLKIFYNIQGLLYEMTKNYNR